MGIRPEIEAPGSCSLDEREGKVLFCETAFLRSLGKEEREVIGTRSDQLLDGFYPSLDPLDAPYDEPMVLVRKADRVRFLGTLRKEGGELRFELVPSDDGAEKDSASMYELFYRSSLDLLVVADPQEQRFITVNPAFTELLGYEKEEAVQKSFFHFVHSDDQELLKGYLMKLMSGEPVEGARVRGITREGEEIWFEWNGVIDPSDGLLYAIGRKVHEEVEAKKELGEKEAWYFLLFDTSPVAKVIHDGDHILDLNQEALKLLKASYKDVMIGERIEDNFTIQGGNELEEEVKRVVEERKRLSSFSVSVKVSKEEPPIELEVDAIPCEYKSRNCAHILLQDVTARNQAERQLAKRESEYRTIVEGIPESIHMLVPEKAGDGLDFRVEFVNEHFARSRGMKKADLIGRSLWNFLEEKNATHLFDPPLRAYQEKEIVDYSAEIVYQGEWRTYEARAIPILEEGEFKRIVVTSRDVTEKKKMEEELEQREEEYRTILAGVPVGIFMLSTDKEGPEEFRFDFINQRFLDDRGMEKGELIGKRLEDVLKEKEGLHLLEHQRKAFEEKRVVEYEHDLLVDKGERCFFERVVPVLGENGDCGLLVGMSQDITEEKEMEARLRQSKEQFRLLVENMNEGIMQLDQDYNVDYVNDVILERLGYDRKNIAGNNLFELVKRIDPENLEKIEEVFQQRKRGKRGQNELNAVAANGEKVPFLISGTPLFSDKGEFEGSIVIFTEITERKELEEQVLNAVIQTQESERKRFAEDLHDGIGQILSAVKMQLYALENAPKEDIEEQLPEIRSMTEKAIDETRTITHDLMPNELRDFGLVQALENLLERMRKQGVQLHFDPPEKNLEFSEELQVACYRIFQELLNNVMKHSGADDVNVEMKMEEEGAFFFRVVDNGRGFVASPEGKGENGILNIKRRAELFGGWVEIHSQPGEGTVAKGSIPVQ